MTTIAFDGKTLAADSLAIGGATSPHRIAQKIFDIGGGVFVAIAGTLGEGAKFAAWYVEGADIAAPALPDLKDSSVLVVSEKHSYEFDETLMPLPVRAPCAIGSGGEVALGAMMAGATASEAVKIACKVDIHSGGRVRCVEVRRR